MRNIIGAVIGVIILFTFPNLSLATEYTLPYPSSMPGSKFYPVYLLWERIMNYWYFGSFAQLAFNLKYSDKYLVEAKTLFEYKQYLLAQNALKKSDLYFHNLNYHLNRAYEEGKNISQKRENIKKAAFRHVEVLQMLKKEVPEGITWRLEKDQSQDLSLWSSINTSIKLRQAYAK